MAYRVYKTGLTVYTPRSARASTPSTPKWQNLGSLHRMFQGCLARVRATPYQGGAEEYVNLELYMAWRGNNLAVETPAVR